MRSAGKKTGLCAIIIVMIAMSLIAGCTSPPPVSPPSRSSAYPAATTIVIQNGVMNPPVLMAIRGTTVTWINEDVPFCTIKSDPGVPDSFTSPVLKPPHVYQFTFTLPGEYPYHCMEQPAIRGTIVVHI
jgi:plastocyanin